MSLRQQAVDSVRAIINEVIDDLKVAIEIGYFIQPDGLIVSNEGGSTLCWNDEPLERVLYLDGSNWRDQISDSEKEEDDFDDDEFFDVDDSYYSDLMEEAINQIEVGYFDDEEVV
ncbi:hypothetical protein MASR2M29_02100 [Spirochaetota bacterium]